MKLLLVFALSLLFCAPAKAMTTGNDLVHRCNAAIHMPDANFPASSMGDAMFCIGLIQGVAETFDMWGEVDGKYHHDEIRHACIPTGVTVEQEIKVFLKYADRHPEELHDAATNLVMFSLMDAFPCKASPK